MEGLIKGLVNVAIDAIAGAGDGDDSNHRRNADRTDDLDERSRATWAEVASAGNETKAGAEQEAGHRRNQWNSRKEESDEKTDGDWEVAGRRKNQHDQEFPATRANKEKSEERNDGDWEVAGNKKHRHQQQVPAARPHKAAAEAWKGYKRPPHEQEYVEDATHGANVDPTRQELEDLSKACSRLWELDVNCLVPGRDYEIDCGRGKKVYQEGDMAHRCLFTWLSDGVFKQPTYSRFCALLDNYNPHEGYKEDITPEDKHEEAAFIEEISRTAPIKYLYHYLVAKDIISANYEDFKNMISHLWFDLYGRGGCSGSSSAFEHVFVGEIKGRGAENEVSGFHNWIQFYLEESKGRVDYQGYIFPRRRGESPDSESQLLTIQFEWNGVLKSVSSTLVGVSPEFELALYTLCFFVGGEDNHVSLGPYAVNVKCYKLGHNKIGSAFPIAES